MLFCPNKAPALSSYWSEGTLHFAGAADRARSSKTERRWEVYENLKEARHFLLIEESYATRRKKE